MDDETLGEHLIEVLCGSAAAVAAEMARGCVVYFDHNPDDEFLIEGVDTTERSVAVKNADSRRRLPFRKVATGYIVDPSGKLADFVRSNRSPEAIAHERNLALAAQFGIAMKLSRDEGQLVSDVLRKLQSSQVPSGVERRQALDVLVTHEDWRSLRSLCDAFIAAHGPDEAIPGDLLIRKATALRHSGNLDEALKLTKTALLHANSYAPSEVAVIATIRAAQLLDTYERRPDFKLLEKARYCAGRAYAIRPSEELGSVYARLNVFEEESAQLKLDAAERERQLEVREAIAKWTGSPMTGRTVQQ